LLYSEERTEIGRLNPVGALSSISLGLGGKLHAGYAGFNAGLSELFTFDATTAVTALPARRGVLPIPGGIFIGPEDFTIGRDGLARVLDRSERVQSLELDGRLDGQWAYGGALGVDAGPDGTIYAVDGKSIEVLDAPPAALALSPLRRWDAEGAAGQPAFLSRVEVQKGTIFTLDIARRSLRRFDALSGVEAPAILLSDPALPSHWADFAVAEDGTAYVLDRLTGDVQLVASDATSRTLALNRPARRLALRPDGEPVLLDEAGRLWHFDVAGNLRGLVDVSRRDMALDSRPSDIDIDDQGRVYVIDRAANIVSRYDWDASAQARQPDVERECVFSYDKIAQPSQVNLGERASIHLTASGECLRRRLPPLDVMLIIDASGSMAGDRIALTRQAAMDFTRALDLELSQVGVVSFSQDARLAIPLSSDEASIWDALRGIRPFGASRIDRGLALAHQEWQANRRPGVGAVFILLSDGRSEVAPTLAAADAIKADGVEIFVVSTRGAPAERALMEAIATTPDHHFEANEPAFLLEVLDAIAERIASVKLLLSATVSDRLPANMTYIIGSATQPPDDWDPITRVLRWDLRDVPFAGFDIRYAIEPTEVGIWPTNVEASVDAINGFGRPESFVFPVPQVEVIAPTPTPTPTPTSTPTPLPKPVYLPIVIRGCTPDQKHTDAMLVIDTSSSMTPLKLAAAKAAARAFVDLLDLPRDQVGLVEFNAAARLVSPLTGDAATIHRAIAALTTSPGTQIDAGLQTALTAMSGPGLRQGNTPTIILLTDGVQPDGQSRILDLGAEICKRKIELFTIGLGSASDVDFNLLQLTACKPGMAFLAPAIADLQGIYATIAAEIPCDPPNWGGRP
jgi:Mg-chelatase subunit ChlD